MKWLLSDGTEVGLGGEVRGATAFAQELREHLGGRYGTPGVGIYPPPGGDVDLELDDPTLLDTFLRQFGGAPYRGADKVTVAKAPLFERRSFPPRADNTPPGAVN